MAITLTRQIPVLDADGVPIYVGSVVEAIDGQPDVGVVVDILTENSTSGPMFSQVGDLIISIKRGITRVSNRWNKWRHVPKERQSISHRLLSWSVSEFEPDGELRISADEQRAISGILAILPDEVVDWDFGPIPDDLYNTLGLLADYIQSLHDNAKRTDHIRTPSC